MGGEPAVKVETGSLRFIQQSYGYNATYADIYSGNIYSSGSVYQSSDARFKTYNESVICGASSSWFAVWVEDVAVRSGGDLTLKAPIITINEPFTIEAGARFYMGE